MRLALPPSHTCWHRRTLLAALALPLAACAPLHPPEAGPVYSGRLSLSVRSEPPQNLSAGFELLGQARAGQLRLSSPLGTTLALARWQPGQAQLSSGGQEQRFGSMEELLAQLTGAALPLAALFDWLDGRPTPVPGWESERLGPERLVARRLSPLPAVELRLLLDPR